MMKTRALSGALAACASLSAAAAPTGFTGAFAPNQFATTVTGNLVGAQGGSAIAGSTALVITGGDAISPSPADFAPACRGATTGLAGPCQISFTTTHVANPFVFDWTYASADSSGAGNDLFGVLIDGIRTQLSDPGGAINQSGHFSAAATGSFGWYVNCTDCIEGAATARITNFQAGSVPEPGTIALLGLGVVAAGATRRKRHRFG